MNGPSNDPIDLVLKRWLADEQPDPEQLDALRTRILTAAERGRSAGSPAAGPALRRSLGKRLSFVLAGAAAAAVCLAIALRALGPRTTAPEKSADEIVLREAGLDKEQILSQARLFARLNEVFTGRLAWVAETDGRVELGVDDRQPPSRNVRPIAVRLVVMDRAAGQSAWHRAWTADLMLECEERVEIRPQDQARRGLAVWAHVLPDGMIAVDASLELSPSCPEVSYSGVERPGATQRIFHGSAAGREFEVYQTVVLLPKEMG